jgi:cell division protein FtsA
MEEIIVGIDVGTTKVCTLVGRVEDAGALHILGVGIEPSNGIKKGVIIDLEAASRSILRSVERAEQSSGIEIASAVVSIAGAHVSSINSRGVVGISGEIVDEYDVLRALEAARSVAIPHNREVIHIVQRGFSIDGQDGIRSPIGMHGYKLEVETHIITAAAATVDNLRQCLAAAGVEVQQFVLNPLASAEAVLTENERQMGAAVCDIGGGTTDMAIYVDGKVWHTMVLAVGGNHVTSDIAHGLRLSVAQAEDIKLQQGYAIRAEVGAEDYFTIRPFGEDQDVQINRQELAHIIEARVEEIFELSLQEIKRSGYDGLLPAGMVLTGGGSALPAIRDLASDVLGIPVRIAQPQNINGMVDQLQSPAYATSVGLLLWTMNAEKDEIALKGRRKTSQQGEKRVNLDSAKKLFKRLLP